MKKKELIIDDKDRLKSIEEDLKFIIDCLAKVTEIKNSMDSLMRDRKYRQEKEFNKLWLQVKISVQMFIYNEQEFILGNIYETREYILGKIDELLKYTERLVFPYRWLYDKRIGVRLYHKDLIILKNLVNYGFDGIKYDDYSCEKLKFDTFSEFINDRECLEYLEKLYMQK